MKNEKLIGNIVCLLITYAIAAPMVLTLAGWFPNTDGIRAAKAIAEGSGDPKECALIVFTFPFSLMDDEREYESLCRTKVAWYVKDPAKCKHYDNAAARFTCLQLVRGKMEYDTTYALREERNCSALEKPNDIARCAFLNAVDAQEPMSCPSIEVASWRDLCALWTEIGEKS